MKVYQRLAEAFIAEGVTATFGMMGDGCMFWLHEMHRRGVKVYEVRHEGAGLGMADGYARALDVPGVCHVTAGPGLTQLATALVTAARANSPLVVFAGDCPLNDPENIQYLDQQRFVEGCEAIALRLLVPEQTDEAVRTAFRRARSERKPVVLSCPQDLQQVDFDFDEPYRAARETLHPLRMRPSDEDLEIAADMIRDAKRPVIVAGRGAQLAGAGPAILALGERIGALLATSLVAQNFLKECEYHAGISGLYATRDAIRLLETADLVIGVGASLNRYTLESGYLYQDARFIRIDVRPDAVMANGRLADLRLCGDARTTVEALEGLLGSRGHASTGFRTPDVRETLRGALRDDVGFPIADGTVDPRLAVRLLDELLPESVGVVKGTGMSNGFSNMLMTRNRRMGLASYAFGCIGQMFPAAMGAIVAQDFGPVCLVDGDASFLMHLAEFETAVRYGMPLLAVVMNNQSIGAEYYKLDAKGMDASTAVIPTPDLGAVARSMGGAGVLVTDLAELAPAVQAFLARPAPTVIDLRISLAVPSIPYRRLQYAEDI